jgi:hypothetical protein
VQEQAVGLVVERRAREEAPVFPRSGTRSSRSGPPTDAGSAVQLPPTAADGVRLEPVRRAEDGGGRFRSAPVSKCVSRELIDLLPTMRLRLRGKHKHGYK